MWRLLTLVLVLLIAACSSNKGATPDAVDVAQADSEQPAETSSTDVMADILQDPLETPVANTQAAAKAFQLYYRERVERVVVSFNRFMVFGDVTFGTVIGKAGVAHTGDQWEVVAGPNDNNRIGVSMRRTWYAYQVFRSRLLALSLMRSLQGLVFFEAVSGHPGVTARMVYPGWTRTVNGIDKTVLRTRNGSEVFPPVAPDPELEAEMLASFFSGVQMTYREQPEDILLNYMPAREIAPYAITYSHSMTPHYLRVSDCCTSLMQVPDGYPWAGGWFGNHNSRDNFPDLAMGYLVALHLMNDPLADEDLRQVAEQAWASGQRIGDLIQLNEGRLMTVSEHDPYEELVVAGGVRPDGETEAEDLGSLSDCQMAFLGRALSSQGLSLPLPELPAPGSVEYMLADVLGEECPVPEPVRICSHLADAYCGKQWGTIGELKLLGLPWLEAIEELEAETPGTAKALIGSFQDDFSEKTIAALAVVSYAEAIGDQQLEEEAREALQQVTNLYRYFGELIWGQTDPGQLAERHYSAALFEVQGGMEVDGADFGDHGRAEYNMSRLEQMLLLEDTPYEALKSDEEILAIVENDLAGKSDSVKARYVEHYGTTPPLRRAGDAYEATGHHPAADWPWESVPTPKHQQLGGVRLLEAIPLCVVAPEHLDCTWAKLGCSRPDLNADGLVDEADQTLMDTAAADHPEAVCGTTNNWCDGADLDHTGTIDSTDQAFMTAAQGCSYAIK